MPHTPEEIAQNDMDEEEDETADAADAADGILELRWEKEVERDLTLLIQTWHAEFSINEKKGRKTASEWLRLQRQFFRQPVYFPLAGDVESALGDALAEADGVLLIECKKKIDADEWAREAMEPEPYKKKNGKPGIRNRGGKGRRKQLEEAAATLDEGLMNRIADECHVIVASSGYGISVDDAIEDGLIYTLYWPFVMCERKEDALIDPHAADELKDKGAEFVDFYQYVKALVDARHADGGEDTTDQEDRFTVLVKRHNRWHGWRLIQSTLVTELEAAARSDKLSEDKKRGLDAIKQNSGNAALTPNQDAVNAQAAQDYMDDMDDMDEDPATTKKLGKKPRRI